MADKQMYNKFHILKCQINTQYKGKKEEEEDLQYM